MTIEARHLYIIEIDVPPEKEADFNRLYDEEHIPALLKVPGVLGASRFQTSEAGSPKYIAVYELERPDVTDTPAWRAAADSGEWPTFARPFLTYGHRTHYTRI